MLSFPHLVVLFVIALIIFGPQKLPELARMLGKATAEFRKMTNDFRFALEDEVREMERQTRIREEQAAAAARAAQVPAPSPSPSPEGTVARELPAASAPDSPAERQAEAYPTEPANEVGAAFPPSVAEARPADSPPDPANAVTVPHEKTSDDAPAV